MLPLLRQIRSSAEAGAQRYSQYAQKSTTNAPRLSVAMSDLSLSVPEPLTPRLVELGVDEMSARRISSAMRRAVLRLKDSCEVGYAQRRQLLQQRADPAHNSTFLSRIPTAYTMLYNKTVDQWTTYLLTSLTPRILKAQSLRKHDSLLSNSSPQPRRPFNQSALPILEQFFERNAFPSRLDKYELALKCDMDYRQIHVWFQNRRSRYRKEGRGLTKTARGSPLLEELEDTVVDTMLPKLEEDLEDRPVSALC
ncbi:hypothetical protein C8Q76DRAFT_791585 [Earliella scabrosa]|nr:hypothetical protein C8Q76DRAFT_791585 [Earliella scabrosa]